MQTNLGSVCAVDIPRKRRGLGRRWYLLLESVYLFKVGLVIRAAIPSLAREEGALVRSHSGHSFPSTDPSAWVKA